MMEHARIPTVLYSSHAATLLGLPNEVFLAVIAQIPYSKGKNLIALKLVNRQLLDFLTDRRSLSELRRLIARIQYSYCLAFRIAKDDPTFGGLDGMDAETMIVNRVFGWMENLYPVVEDHSNPHNEAHLLHTGLHLFFAVSRLGLELASEYEDSSLLYQARHSGDVVDAPDFHENGTMPPGACETAWARATTMHALIAGDLF